jgi:hypothetical protein
MRSFTIEINGLPQRALWRRDGADSVEIRTAYGTVWANLQGRDPAVVAREVLTSLAPPLANPLRVQAKQPTPSPYPDPSDKPAR